MACPALVTADVSPPFGNRTSSTSCLSIICWNYLYLSQRLAQETEEERREALLAALKQGSIVIWHHLNLHGEYDFSEEKLQDSVGFNLSKILAIDVS